MKKTDTYSNYYNFTYKGQPKYKTIFGGISTLISWCLILIFSLILGKDLIFKENPKIIN